MFHYLEEYNSLFFDNYDPTKSHRYYSSQGKHLNTAYWKTRLMACTCSANFARGYCSKDRMQNQVKRTSTVQYLDGTPSYQISITISTMAYPSGHPGILPPSLIPLWLLNYTRKYESASPATVSAGKNRSARSWISYFHCFFIIITIWLFNIAMENHHF